MPVVSGIVRNIAARNGKVTTGIIAVSGYDRWESGIKDILELVGQDSLRVREACVQIKRASLQRGIGECAERVISTNYVRWSIQR
jgi:hypothetical protein